MEDINDNVKNLYVIRRRLAELIKKPGHSCFTYYVGNFIIRIFTHRVREHSTYNSDERITNYDIVDINLLELKRFNGGGHTEDFINLETDSRFAEYKPIKYSEWSGYSSGREMPLDHLCELVKYLHRLSNLSAFL